MTVRIRPTNRRRARAKGTSAEPPSRSIPFVPVSGTLGSWLHHIGAEVSGDWIPVWPPDAFAISAAFLRRTGGYAGFVNGEFSGRSVDRPYGVVGQEWRRVLSDALSTKTSGPHLRQACPDEVKRWWGAFRSHANAPLVKAASDPEVVAAACGLCVSSDEACKGLGVRIDPEDPFLGVGEALQQQNDWRSYCLTIPPETLAVLPKQHTPQVGCTIRSLSHNLALYSATEIQARWMGPYRPAEGTLDVLNLLLLPWPTEVQSSDFTLAGSRRGMRGEDSAAAARYFDYEPSAREAPNDIARRVSRALAASRKHATAIHGVVFPEMALAPDQYAAIERVVTRAGAILIAGVRGRGGPDGKMPVNQCVMQLAGLANAPSALRHGRVLESMRHTQLKHHRWCLNRDQILQYALGGRLPASRDCWERIFVGPREVNFVTLGSWLTLCVLICEDLARQDPVAEVIRAVGPNILFALLMDGPQLKERWSARYASVLAEDPGTSVLSMTSLGMARRSRREGTDSGPDRSTTIALWRDAVYGPRELSLGPGDDACVLSLVSRSGVEKTIDGRIDDEHAYFPVFAGVHPFAVPGHSGSRRPAR